MHSGLTRGTQAALVWEVAAEHSIHLGYPAPSLDGGMLVPDDGQPPSSAVVFSTPFMVLLMERAARKAIEPYLEPGEVSVGAMVQVDHLAGTPLGAEVRGVATVTVVDGRSIEFDIAAYDRHEQIGRGRHRRAVVRVERVAQRIAEKASGAGGAKPLTWIDGVAGMPVASEADNSVQPAKKRLEDPVSAGDSMGPAPAGLPETVALRVEVQGRIAKVILNRPEKKNAVNLSMTDDWERLNRYLSGHPEIRVVLVTGAGGAFCAGDDVPEVGTLSLQQAQELSYRQARVYLGWEQLPQVFLAAIDGEALGGGCVAACACDLRIASHGAKLGMPEIMLGWPPGYGVAQLTALIGKGRAMQMCLTGQPITGAQGLEYGLVHRVTPSARLLAEAHRWADELLAMPAAALRETKRLVHADEGLQPKTAFLADTAAYIRCLGQPDAREGIAAFRSKRPPRFSPE